RAPASTAYRADRSPAPVSPFTHERCARGEASRWVPVSGYVRQLPDMRDCGKHIRMTWSAPHIDRRSEPYVADERTMLLGWINWNRDTLLHKCAGLTAEQLKRASVEPSKLTLVGLVRHMANVERAWFRKRVAGEEIDSVYGGPDNVDADFD